MKLLLLFLMVATFTLSASQTAFAAFYRGADKNPPIRVMSEDDECPPEPPDPPDNPE